MLTSYVINWECVLGTKQKKTKIPHLDILQEWEKTLKATREKTDIT